MKKSIYLSMTLTVLAFQYANAQTKPNQDIYPFKPYETERISSRVETLAENKDFIWNIHEMDQKGLTRANTTVQPWGGSYWPLNNGMVANTYHDFKSPIEINWQINARAYDRRTKKVHTKGFDLSQKELDTLAPSEKYDLLLGDTSFDLTNRIWGYARKWGAEKKWGFVSHAEIPAGHRLPEGNNSMALWEGICHGWAIAAGHHPRPEKTVNIKLPNGKTLPFYPEDIKALVSVMWAHSLIQDHVLFEGGRCNKSFPKRDRFGRYVDVGSEENAAPNCADTHPAIFHLAMLNVLGVEGRSFVIDHKAEGPIANQPVSGYEFQYFHPVTGKIGSLADSLATRETLGDKDLFKSARNAEATHLVGINMTLKYVNWKFPSKKTTDSPEDDKVIDMEFNYDLEVNTEGKIVGGQWRIRKNGHGLLFKKPNIPDFFWIAPRNWKNWFKGRNDLPEWNFELSNLPPKEYQAAAKNAHGFEYEMSEKFLGWKPQCPVFPVKGGAPINVDCEFKYPRPQPLIQVVDKLLELSRN